MIPKLLLTSIAIALFSVAVLAETKSDVAVPAATKSDYDRSYDFSKLRTWDFKVTTRMPEDPVGTNTLWNQRIHDGLVAAPDSNRLHARSMTENRIF